MPQPTDTLVRMPGIIGHEVVLRLLERTTERPAPGYLFHGPDGVGKREAARWFASKLLSCDLSHLTSHPDFIRLKREEGARGIPVETVRELVARMRLTAAQGGRKVAVIEEADALNETGTNVLLKAVEEPGDGSTYVFVAERPERLPATLRSRLVSIAFGPVSSDVMRAWLTPRVPDAAWRERVVSAARGRPGVAERLLEDRETFEDRETSARALLDEMVAAPLGRAIAAIERVAKETAASRDPETAWNEMLATFERLLPDAAVGNPGAFSRVAHGLVLARRFVGGPISPHLALEWSLLASYYEGEIPSFLHPSYL